MRRRFQNAKAKSKQALRPTRSASLKRGMKRTLAFARKAFVRGVRGGAEAAGLSLTGDYSCGGDAGINIIFCPPLLLVLKLRMLLLVVEISNSQVLR